MNENLEEPPPVARHLVPEDRRLAVTAELFGAHFPLMIEPVVYGITERMAESYSGGYWPMYTLDNGDFYMAPEGDQVFAVSCDNYFTGKLSADALGITAGLYAFSHCSFSRDEAFGRVCAQHYHWLRAFMYDHPEVAGVSAGVKARLFAAVLGCRAHTECVVKNLSYDFCSGTSNGHKNRVWA